MLLELFNDFPNNLPDKLLDDITLHIRDYYEKKKLIFEHYDPRDNLNEAMKNLHKMADEKEIKKYSNLIHLLIALRVKMVMLDESKKKTEIEE